MNAEERIAALEVEADRVKARLDQLDRYLTGDQDAWLSITLRMPPDVAEVTIDKALSEARQQALALTTITRTLASLKIEAAASTGPDPADEVKRKREEKLAAARAAQS